MDIGQNKLRAQFKAETDLDIDNLSKYAKWLESLRIKSLNTDLFIENSHLKHVLVKAINILDEGITAIPK